MIRTLLAATAAALIAAPAVQAQEKNIAETAMGNPELSTLVDAVKAAGLAETLQGEGPFTVFAPTNAAFEALPAGTLEELLKPENKGKLAQILSYHVIQGDEVTSSEITAEMTPATVQGADLDIAPQDGKVMVEEATVVTPDVEASNGVVHLIDKVLIPEGVM